MPGIPYQLCPAIHRPSGDHELGTNRGSGGGPPGKRSGVCSAAARLMSNIIAWPVVAPSAPLAASDPVAASLPPSGDHAWTPACVTWVTACRSLPSGRIFQICSELLRLEKAVIHPPSGDHRGTRSIALSLVSWRDVPEPSVLKI